MPDGDRYARMPYRRTGRSGLMLPAITLGLWQNFGGDRPIEVQRATIRRAFDLGITHFDLANNYGPPYGSAEENFGRILRKDFRPYRDELIISTKAGWDMWPGPYGQLGLRKYLLASLDASLERMGLDYVDIFYSHRFDPATPLEETMGALASAVPKVKTPAAVKTVLGRCTKAANAVVAATEKPREKTNEITFSSNDSGLACHGRARPMRRGGGQALYECSEGSRYPFQACDPRGFPASCRPQSAGAVCRQQVGGGASRINARDTATIRIISHHKQS